jgi:hypothetical protein
MSREALYSVIGRSRVDIDFGSRLLENFTQTVQDAGYILTDEEIVYAKQNLPAATASVQGMPSQNFQQQLAMKTANEFTELNITIHKNNFKNASKTYERISLMSSIMFGTGIGLFIFAALYGAFSQQLSYTFVFAGLGAANFIALFILKPMDKSQEALSNLLQAEIAYMNYSNQVTLWGSMYLVPTGFPPRLDPASIKTTSEELQKLTRETMDLLQTYIETPVTKPPEKE